MPWKDHVHAVQAETILRYLHPADSEAYGKMIDNHGKMKPVYLEQGDKRKPDTAKKAFRKLVGQNPALRDRDDFEVKTADIYELVRLEA